MLISPPGAASPVLCWWSGPPATTFERLYGDPAAIWRGWAGDVKGLPIASGHHIAEETPSELAAALAGFLQA